MGLKKYEIIFIPGPRTTKEMVKTHFENFCRGSVACDVSTQFTIGFVRTHDHNQRIPTNNRGDPLLEFHVTRVDRLLSQRDGILVGREWRYVRHQPQFTRV